MAAFKEAGLIKMTGLHFLLSFCFLIVQCSSQELVITHAPKYVTFQQQTKDLQTSDIPKVITHTLGIHSESDSGAEGILQGSLFKRPKANVLVTLISHKDLTTSPVSLNKVASFPVKADDPLVDMDSVMNSIQRMFLEDEPLMMDLMADSNILDLRTENQLFRRLPNSLLKLKDRLLDGSSIIHKLDIGSLNNSLTSDLTLMGELQMIDDVLHTLNQNSKLLKSKTPDLFSFTITGLKSIIDKHGAKSPQTADAQKLLQDFLHYMTSEFKKQYKDNVVVEVLSVSSPQKIHSRKSRSLMQVPSTTPVAPTPNMGDLNLAAEYGEMYPAMFNIILWLTVFLAIMFFIIGYAMWFIDPGVDSIIYRMTSQRLKKD